MKSILMSIRPQHLEKILNGDATMLLRKRVPKGFVGWVYMWVSKSKNEHLYYSFSIKPNCYVAKRKIELKAHNYLNSTIPARFWWDDVEQIQSEVVFNRRLGLDYRYNVFYGDLCLDKEEFENYIGEPINEIKGITDYKAYFIQIRNLEIFNVPKSLGEFKKYIPDEEEFCNKCGETYFDYSENTLYCTYVDCDVCPKMFVTNTPKNYIFVEVQDV